MLSLQLQYSMAQHSPAAPLTSVSSQSLTQSNDPPPSVVVEVEVVVVVVVVEVVELVELLVVGDVEVVSVGQQSS